MIPLLRPVITEKATMANENGQVSFVVPMIGNQA
jgi:ribosomal protein L23